MTSPAQAAYRAARTAADQALAAYRAAPPPATPAARNALSVATGLRGAVEVLRTAEDALIVWAVGELRAAAATLEGPERREALSQVKAFARGTKRIGAEREAVVAIADRLIA